MLLCLLALAACGLAYLLLIAPVGAGYKAKVLCSAVFVSGRDPESVLAEDVRVDSYRILRLFGARIDREERTVSCSLLGLRARTAAYRPGLGATLAVGALFPPALSGGPAAEVPWPGGPPSVAGGELQAAVDAAFGEPNPRRLRRTRAVAVVKDGRLVAERYAPGFGPDIPLAGWSMAKSVMGALVGILVGDGKLSLDRAGLLPEWSGAGDLRARITLEDLLRMRSGLRFRELYDKPLEDVDQMIFNRGDAAAFAAAMPLEGEPGTRWAYASGTSNIVSRIARLALGGPREDYLRFPRRRLFGPIGMSSAVFEIDAAGHFVASSFLYATARDWARFGWLIAAGGLWAGRRILPEGWARFCASPTPQSPDGRYGAHWWLKIPDLLGGRTEAAKRIPADALHAIGHEGQVLSVVPSRGLVAVRLGLSPYLDAWDHAAFLSSVLEAI